MKPLFFSFFLSVVIIWGCENKEGAYKDEFYNLKKSYTDIMPVIKPYAAKYNDDVEVWNLDLYNGGIKYFEFPTIDSLNVYDSIIIAQCAWHCSLPDGPC